jgi:hypothetical protein
MNEQPETFAEFLESIPPSQTRKITDLGIATNKLGQSAGRSWKSSLNTGYTYSPPAPRLQWTSILPL